MDDLTSDLSVLQGKLEFAIEVEPSAYDKRRKQAA